MEVFKPNSSNSRADLQADDAFFTNSHGLTQGQGEHTLCSIACEEWNYNEYEVVKEITCVKCLEVIKHCKSYKGKTK